MNKFSLGISLFVFTAFFPAISPARENWLASCYKNSRGNLDLYDCQARYIEKLKTEQQTILDRIKKLLSNPSPEGTDYAAALIALEKSQQSWQEYIDLDCTITNKIFGRGNALGLAGGECEIQHLEQRNSILSQHESLLLP
jgi:uncharacterized protein YecT (DUF1311 family)